MLQTSESSSQQQELKSSELSNSAEERRIFSVTEILYVGVIIMLIWNFGLIDLMASNMFQPSKFQAIEPIKAFRGVHFQLGRQPRSELIGADRTRSGHD
jgi:hypothetical protein